MMSFGNSRRVVNGVHIAEEMEPSVMSGTQLQEVRSTGEEEEQQQQYVCAVSLRVGSKS